MVDTVDRWLSSLAFSNSSILSASIELKLASKDWLPREPVDGYVVDNDKFGVVGPTVWSPLSVRVDVLGRLKRSCPRSLPRSRLSHQDEALGPLAAYLRQ